MATVPPITTNSTTSTGTSASDAAPLPTQTLSQADFLQLLVTQLSAQDPMNPQSNLDSIAQMAQFSALQESQTTETDMARLNATALIGQTVSVQNTDGTTANGVVSGMQVNSGTPQIVINGMPYDLTQIMSVTPTPVTPTSPASTTQTP
jgi:flagellar basal-body rod modification protein FlgD